MNKYDFFIPEGTYEIFINQLMELKSRIKKYKERMKIEPINTPAAGTWPRDCELISLSYYKGVKLSYHKDEEDTYWNIKCEDVVAYRLINEEFSRDGYLINLPIEGSFYEISDSPWISAFGQDQAEILNKCKHYVFQFYDETIEIIAQKCFFEKLNEKPNIEI